MFRFISVKCVILAGFSVLIADAFAEETTIPGVSPLGKVQRLHTDFAFTEGPAADADGNLYFTDIPNNRIHKRDRKGTLSVFAEPSGHCNGLMVIGDRLYVYIAYITAYRERSVGNGILKVHVVVVYRIKNFCDFRSEESREGKEC